MTRVKMYKNYLAQNKAAPWEQRNKIDVTLETKSKITNTNLTLSVMTLNVNGLYTPIKN